MLLDVLHEEQKLIETELFTHIRFGLRAVWLFLWIAFTAVMSWWFGRYSKDLETLLLAALLVLAAVMCVTAWLLERIHVRRLEKKSQAIDAKIAKWYDDPEPWLYD